MSDPEIIAYFEENYSVFNIVSFCKHFELNSKTSAQSTLASLINNIAKRNLKLKESNKPFIRWARQTEKNLIHLFDSIPLRQYFYEENRKALIIARKNARVLLAELQSVQDQEAEICATNSSNADSTRSSVAGPFKSLEKKVAASSSASLSSVDPADSTAPPPNEDSTTTERKVCFTSMFDKLDNSKKWYLSTGKCVDNELYYFGLQCSHDHPSQSLIDHGSR
ncbi:hypothetical protein MBANPS3_006282 [Mucor bainieri]